MGGSAAAFLHSACSVGGIANMADEVWAINATGAVLQHDRAFCMDDLRDTIPREAKEGKKVAQQMLEWIKKHPGPVYSSTAYPEYPSVVEFPIRDVLANIGGISYLNTTVAHAIAFAMYLGVQELGLYGCDYSYPDIHISESGRGCAEFLLGIAVAKGMTLKLPPTTTLLDQNVPDDFRVYGYPRGLRVRMAGKDVHVQHGPFPTSTSTGPAPGAATGTETTEAPHTP